MGGEWFHALDERREVARCRECAQVLDEQDGAPRPLWRAVAEHPSAGESLDL
jgi:hypothetical protein